MLLFQGLWLPELDFNFQDKIIIEEKGMLSDKHMLAVSKLLKVQFPHMQGLHTTLLSQSHGFPALSLSDGITPDG